VHGCGPSWDSALRVPLARNRVMPGALAEHTINNDCKILVTLSADCCFVHADLLLRYVMPAPPSKPPSRAQISQSASEARDKLVREMIEKERAAVDAKTARLRALRLAKEITEPPRVQPKRGRKPTN
jgi:hypothetical protein